jgi:hypothetical protein
MKSLPPLSLTRDETRAVRNAVRALGRHLEADQPDPGWERIEKLVRDWDRPEIQQMVRGATAAEEFIMLGLALRFRALNVQAAARDRQVLSAKAKAEKFEDRDRWICEQYARRKNRDRSYSRARFRRELQDGVILIPDGLRGSFRPHGRFISEERLRKIVTRP